MSYERVVKALVDFGLSQLDADVFILLSKKGPQKGMDIAKALKIHKQQVYRNLSNLQSKGIVNATLDHPARYSAKPLQEIMDLFIKVKMEEAQRLRQSKEAILQDWRSIQMHESEDDYAKFTVMKGRNIIYSKIRQMIEQTKTCLSTITTVPNLVRADQFGLLETAFKRAKKDSIHFRFLTDLSPQNTLAIKSLLNRSPKSKFSLEVRIPDLDLKPPNRMVIRDYEEAIFFINPGASKAPSEQDDVCLWTNSKTIVSSFQAVFEELWQNSTEIKEKLVEIETGKAKAKTCIINDPEAAKKRYQEAMDLAKKEIVITTSPTGLVETCNNIARLKERAKKGISIRIMAPIKRDNLEAAIKLSGCCEVKHVPMSYLNTTIIDGEALFQFKSSPPDRKDHEGSSSFVSTIYTNDFEYIDGTKSLLDEVWKNAIAPSAITLEEITRPPLPTIAPVPEDEHRLFMKDGPYQKSVIDVDLKPEAITEKYVLEKIINAKRIPPRDPLTDMQYIYGSSASAVVHPPSTFNLPDMILAFHHNNKQSSLGAEDWLDVSLWLETPKGFAFVPVATGGDNPEGMKLRKFGYAGTPAGKNCLLLEKDEIQVQVHGNTLFAGWTVPIPLLSPNHTLPPGGLLVEGYGKVKTGATKMTLPSGAKAIFEGNSFDAFVTFFHPASKYAGPGTDGILGRDIIMTIYPPSSLILK